MVAASLIEVVMVVIVMVIVVVVLIVECNSSMLSFVIVYGRGGLRTAKQEFCKLNKG